MARAHEHAADEAAEAPVMNENMNAEATSIFSRELPPQQQAQDAALTASAKDTETPSQSNLSKLVKELGQITDPELKDACRSRRKGLKSALACLQSPKSTPDEREQQLVKFLATQVTELGRVEKLVVPTQAKLELEAKRRELVEQELSRQTAINSKLQDLCRSLQGQSRLLKDQLEKQKGLDQAERDQQSALQTAMETITTRLDEEKGRLAEVHDLFEQNATLKEQVAMMARQIELQQELTHRQAEQHARIQSMVLQQEKGEELRREQAAKAISILEEKNAELQEQVHQRDTLIESQHKQFEDCNAAIRQAKKGFSTYQRSLQNRQQEVDTLTKELVSFRELYRALQEECGQNVLESVQKGKAVKTALENLCRALQEQNRRLQADIQPVSAAAKVGSEVTSSANVTPQVVGSGVGDAVEESEAGNLLVNTHASEGFEDLKKDASPSKLPAC